MGYFRSDSRELCADASNSVSFRFSLKFCNQSGRSASGSFEFFLSLLFLFWFWIFGNGTSLLDASSSLRSDTGHEDELEAGGTSSLIALSESFLNESCDGVAGDELLSGLVDPPWSDKKYEIICLADDSLPVFGQSWLWTVDPSIRGLRQACLATRLQAFHRVNAGLQTD